jgi:pantoate--beta-alanine ligase
MGAAVVAKVARTEAEVRQAVALARSAGGSVVCLVPTMGALHGGHARLIQRGRELADYLVVSIFVNPTQFGPAEDLARYPRTLELDLACCEKEGADLVFVPDETAMYPNGRNSTFVEVGGLSQIFEGASRPGHFRGVATVVLALFEIVRPDLAVFGQKDYQQARVIARMVEDLHLPIRLVTVATVREPDGLALSSRNRYLNPEERKAAPVLHRALEQARALVAGGERSAERVRQAVSRSISSEPLARLDYVAVADAASLDPLESIEPGRAAVVLAAVWIGSTRLIDNVVLME